MGGKYRIMGSGTVVPGNYRKVHAYGEAAAVGNINTRYVRALGEFKAKDDVDTERLLVAGEGIFNGILKGNEI